MGTVPIHFYLQHLKLYCLFLGNACKISSGFFQLGYCPSGRIIVKGRIEAPANITFWERISGGGKCSTSLAVRAHPSYPSLAYEQALQLGKSRLRNKWRADSHAKPHLHFPLISQSFLL